MDNFRPILMNFMKVWCIYEQFQMIYGKIRPVSRTLWTFLSKSKLFFSQEGRYPGYRHTQRNTLIHSKWKERGKRKVIWCNRHIDIYPLRQKGINTRHANHTAGGKAQSYDGQPRPSQRGKQRPHPASRDPHLLGRQPGHQGERASVKETSRTQRLQPVH